MRKFLFAIAATMTVAGTPVIAQDAMKAAPMKKMSAAETRKMKACQAMPHDKMMKDAGCAKMMKMHPEMMKGDDMMMKKGT